MAIAGAEISGSGQERHDHDHDQIWSDPNFDSILFYDSNSEILFCTVLFDNSTQLIRLLDYQLDFEFGLYRL